MIPVCLFGYLCDNLTEISVEERSDRIDGGPWHPMLPRMLGMMQVDVARSELRFISLLALQPLLPDLKLSIMAVAGMQPMWQRYDPSARARGSMTLSQWNALQRILQDGAQYW